ncbi:histidinol-phosphatase HisJ [Halobacillus locisalis]|uniref:Histidinol-phosphatase n=1 Tax=Halobacillus locisalis TaxID=220753 RepID=A0A838CMK3_9BACI|nr:histidinol-phosphatase HisJ [Halobacillus locisalis]MBA2173320.1 histidinol-phosphatase HisJ [Halobacillus locisalis]
MIDGHIHSPYCPHGTSDSLKSYIERAIGIGYTSMTFTEHAPLPVSFDDPVPDKDSGMDRKDVEPYIESIQALKKEYQKELDISVGFEIDYISGYEKETEQFLNQYGPELDDGILSVHFLKASRGWYCIDFSPHMFKDALHDFGSSQLIYQAYFDAVRSSVEADLGYWKPNRIGHMTLIRKFNKLYPSPDNWEKEATKVLKAVNEKGLSLDYNGAGTKKPHCKETYPTMDIAEQAQAIGIPLIYGSDAHQATDLFQGHEHLAPSFLKG